MDGRNHAAGNPDPVPALSDSRRSGLLSDLRALEVRQLRGGLDRATLAPAGKLSDIQFRDPLTPAHPDRPADPRPPAITPTFQQQEVDPC